MDLSPEWMLASLVVSSFGFGLFVYGKKQLRMPHLVVGIALMGFPYVATSLPWMLIVAGVLLVGLRVTTRMGA